jgi:hypothetical protein
MSHTPGPWHRGDGQHWSREIRGADGIGVAWCGHHPFEDDARLIKAAPIMYEFVAAAAAGGDAAAIAIMEQIDGRNY